MERPKNIINHKKAIPIRIIILFHLIGIIGLSMPATKSLFLQLVPYHLLLMLFILFFTHDKLGTKFILFFMLIFTIGFAVEWAGVHTGQIFGNYTYGPTLGFDIEGIPLIIGINWFLLIYSVGVILQQSAIKHIVLRILTGAATLVLLDFLIEPVAIQFNYWHWAVGGVPVNNYIAWFILSAILLFVFELFKFKKQGIVGVVLLISQFIFFISLLSQPAIKPEPQQIKLIKSR